MNIIQILHDYLQEQGIYCIIKQSLYSTVPENDEYLKIYFQYDIGKDIKVSVSSVCIGVKGSAVYGSQYSNAYNDNYGEFIIELAHPNSLEKIIAWLKHKKVTTKAPACIRNIIENKHAYTGVPLDKVSSTKTKASICGLTKKELKEAVKNASPNPPKVVFKKNPEIKIIDPHNP